MDGGKTAYFGVPVYLVYEAGEADGSLCMYCGDEIYLTAMEVHLHSLLDDSFQGKLKTLLCGSCGEEFDKVNRPPPEEDENGIPDFL